MKILCKYPTSLYAKILGVNKDTGIYLTILSSHYSNPIANIKLNVEILKIIPLIHKQDKVVHSLLIQSTT